MNSYTPKLELDITYDVRCYLKIDTTREKIYKSLYQFNFHKVVENFWACVKAHCILFVYNKNCQKRLLVSKLEVQ